MDPLRATAEALHQLADLGDEDLATRVAWICASVLELAPHADALAIWFSDEDLTLVFVTPASRDLLDADQPAMGSSLALSIASPTRLVSVVTVYSQHAAAFTGRVRVLERAVGATAGASVVDEDLAFEALGRAEEAPAQLHARRVRDTAIGLLMGTHGLDVDGAEGWIDRVARATGRTPADVASMTVASLPGTGTTPPPA